MYILFRPVYCSDDTDVIAPESASSDLPHCIGKISAASQKLRRYSCFLLAWCDSTKE